MIGKSFCRQEKVLRTSTNQLQWTKARDNEEKIVLAFLTPGDLSWSKPVAVADLLQLWTDVQGAAGGGARSGLN